MPVAEAEPARDPSRAGVAATDPAVVVVQAPTVPVHEPARGIGDELAERRHPVLQRAFHLPNLLRGQNAAAALALLPRYVARRTVPIEVCDVEIR
jgi:hypothetical protein